MSHKVHQTMAVVLSTRNFGEYNKLAVLYSKEFGLIHVSAQSVRKLESKMKNHLLIYSMIHVDIVRGRNIWKLVGTEEYISSLPLVSGHWYEIVEKYSAIINRLCPGEQKSEELWHEIYYLYEYVKIDSTYSKSIEIIMLARTLFILGYWSGTEKFIHAKQPFSQFFFNYVNKNKENLVIKINTGLKNSQL